MSNVLMGLIGVILFAGLALTAATYLGSGFIESSNNGRAAAALSATGQIAQAATLIRMNDGVVLDASDDLEAEVVATRYLKVMPVNPILSVSRPFLVTDDGGTSGPATAAVMNLGSATKPICASIARVSGLIATNVSEPPTSTTVPAHHNGCFRAAPDSTGAFTPLNYYVFTRI